MTHRANGDTRNITDPEFQRRAAELMKAEDDNPMVYWFLSFVGDFGWRGTIIRSPGFVHAVVYAGILGCNPGGEVMGLEVPPDQIPPPEYHDRLLTKDDCEKFWGGMKTVAAWDDEAKKLRLAGYAPDTDKDES